MARYALLIGGPAGFPNLVQAAALDEQAIVRQLRRFGTRLAALGAMSFVGHTAGESAIVIPNTPSELLAEIEKFPQASRDGNDVFLLAYVGHSIPRSKESIYISYKRVEDPIPDDHTFLYIVERLMRRQFKKFICILDCCHAIYALDGLNLAGVEHYTMFSSATGYANSDASGGVFLNAFIEALRVSYDDPLDQRMDLNRSAVTFEGVFRYAASRLPASAASAWGNLGSTPVYELLAQLPDMFNANASRVAVYRKLFAALEFLQQSNKAYDIEELIGKLQNLPEFEARVLGDVPEPINASRVQQLIEFLGSLRLLEASEGDRRYVRLSDTGKRAADQKYYNVVLREAIVRHALPLGCTIKVMREIIVDLLRRGFTPDETTIAIELAARREPIYVRDRAVFREAIRLLPYTGIFRRPSSGTLFPGWQFESEVSIDGAA